MSSDMNVRFQLEDLKAWGREADAVALPDNSGYIGTLNVYHEIHCVVSTHLQVLHYQTDGSCRSGCTPICTKSFIGLTSTTIRGRKTDYILV